MAFCENGHAFRHVLNVFWFVIYGNIHDVYSNVNAFEIDSSITNQSNTHGHIHSDQDNILRMNFNSSEKPKNQITIEKN